MTMIDDAFLCVGSHARSAQDMGGGGDPKERFRDDAPDESVHFVCETVGNFGGLGDGCGGSRSVAKE
jgi:hypothetical protein